MSIYSKITNNVWFLLAIIYIYRQISCKTLELFFGVPLKLTGEAILIRKRSIYFGLKMSKTIGYL